MPPWQGTREGSEVPLRMRLSPAGRLVVGTIRWLKPVIDRGTAWLPRRPHRRASLPAWHLPSLAPGFPIRSAGEAHVLAASPPRVLRRPTNRPKRPPSEKNGAITQPHRKGSFRSPGILRRRLDTRCTPPTRPRELRSASRDFNAFQPTGSRDTWYVSLTATTSGRTSHPQTCRRRCPCRP